MADRPQLAGQQLIVLASDEPAVARRATAAMGGLGGRVLHRYGPRVVIADVRRGAAEAIGGLNEVRSVHAAAVDTPPAGLTAGEELGVAAWNLRRSASFAAAKQERPHDGVAWDGQTGPLPPDGPGMVHVEETPLGLFGLENLSPYLMGPIALALVMVDGPTPDLTFSDDDRTKVVAEVQEGLGWLATRDPRAQVSFRYDVKPVTIDTAVDPGRSGYEGLESQFRDPALSKLGFMGNLLGLRDFAFATAKGQGTRFGYVGFFTKYPLAHFAYAGRPRIVMQFDNDGWGPDNIDRVFTHESGHIFGCPDEYASSGCHCDTKFGYLREPNSNCQNCATPFVDCLMASNAWSMCNATPVQLGWRDSDSDGTLDPIDPVDHPLIDVRGICEVVPLVCQLVGQSPIAAGVRGVTGVAGGAGTADPGTEAAVPMELLRQTLGPAELARVEDAIRAQEIEYLMALERKLRAGLRDVRRHRTQLEGQGPT